jgi:hypothetical protein
MLLLETKYLIDSRAEIYKEVAAKPMPDLSAKQFVVNQKNKDRRFRAAILNALNLNVQHAQAEKSCR